MQNKARLMGILNKRIKFDYNEKELTERYRYSVDPLINEFKNIESENKKVLDKEIVKLEKENERLDKENYVSIFTPEKMIQSIRDLTEGVVEKFMIDFIKDYDLNRFYASFYAFDLNKYTISETKLSFTFDIKYPLLRKRTKKGKQPYEWKVMRKKIKRSELERFFALSLNPITDATSKFIHEINDRIENIEEQIKRQKTISDEIISSVIDYLKLLKRDSAANNFMTTWKSYKAAMLEILKIKLLPNFELDKISVKAIVELEVLKKK